MSGPTTPEARQRYRRSPRGKFNAHKCMAKQRGIPFLFTFEEWWRIWQDSGHWHERGRKRGQYVMSRPGDRGPYAPDNVAIILTETNLNDRNRGIWLGRKHSAEARKNMSIASHKREALRRETHYYA